MVQFDSQAEDPEVPARIIRFGTTAVEDAQDIIKAGDWEVDQTGRVEVALEGRRPG